MAKFIAFEFVPFSATLFIWVGCASFIFIACMGVAVFAFGKPVRDTETGDIVPLTKVAKTLMTIGGANLFFVAVGLTLSNLTQNVALDPEPILWVFGSLNLLGGLFALFLIWHRLRRRT